MFDDRKFSGKNRKYPEYWDIMDKLNDERYNMEMIEDALRLK